MAYLICFGRWGNYGSCYRSWWRFQVKCVGTCGNLWDQIPYLSPYPVGGMCTASALDSKLKCKLIQSCHATLGIAAQGCWACAWVARAPLLQLGAWFYHWIHQLQYLIISIEYLQSYIKGWLTGEWWHVWDIQDVHVVAVRWWINYGNVSAMKKFTKLGILPSNLYRDTLVMMSCTASTNSSRTSAWSCSLSKSGLWVGWDIEIFIVLQGRVNGRQFSKSHSVSRYIDRVEMLV